MGRQSAMRKRILSGLLTMSMMAVILTFVVAGTGETPTVHIDGLELRMVAEYERDVYGQYKKDDDGNLIPIMDTTTGKQAQSIQALVSVAISNVEDYKCTGIFLPLTYDSTYLVPSDWYTNGEITEIKNNGSDIDADHTLHHLFFNANEGLYNKEDPFAWTAGDSTGLSESIPVSVLAVYPDTKVVTVHLSLKTGMEELAAELNSPVRKLSWDNYGNIMTDNYFEVPENTKLTLGTISFRVVGETGKTSLDVLQQKLQDLIDEYDGDTYTSGTAGEQQRLFNTYGNKESAPAGKDKLYMWHQEEQFNQYQRVVLDEETRYTIHIASDDSLVKAEPVLKEITVNSYEAYTDGRVSDLALTMQKYAESVRKTSARGNLSDQAIYWGEKVTDCATMPDDGPGMFIQKLDGAGNKVGNRYQFIWDDAAPDGYTLKVWDDTANEFVSEDPSTFVYDPRGDQAYLISQYFTYRELDGPPPEDGDPDTRKLALKAYPIPVEVKLTVTPIQVTAASVDNGTVTYQNVVYKKTTAPGGVPERYSGLELADDAKLTLDTALNGVVPTIPVAWTPGNLSVTVDSVTTGITGTAGQGNPRLGDTNIANWPVVSADYTAKTGIGDYNFTSSITKASIAAAYPWLTANADYTFTSVRRIVDTEGDADAQKAIPELASRYEVEIEPYESTLGGEIGNLQITIAKRSAAGTAYEDMPSDSAFRLYLPDSTEVAVDSSFNIDSDGWFGTKSASSETWYDATTQTSYQVSFVEDLANKGGKDVYRIFVSPGILGKQSTDVHYVQRESLRRYINLGGWFGVQVHDGGKNAGVWTEIIPAYSVPRSNIYIKSYTGEETDAANNIEPLFNYTGKRAGLMPFYLTSNLPTFVTLPADEQRVQVRYDAFTGAQPGALRQFGVSGWSKVSATSGVTAPPWSDKVSNGAVVTYGDDLFARAYQYSDNGLIVNPGVSPYTGYPETIRDRKVIVKVQPQNEPVTEGTPKPELRLTYELSGDSITYTGDGQVDRVTFNTKQVGYTYQQVVTLTLTNTGNTELRGLHIDVPTAAFTDGVSGPYFNIISAPAVNLPAGASTTFQVSYVPNLPVGTYQDVTATERIHILDETGAERKNFEAVLKVTEGKLHSVTVVVHPGEAEDTYRLMGDASLVTGVVSDVYDSTAAASSYEQNNLFWVLTEPVDEYKLLTTDKVQVYYENEDGEKVYLTEYVKAGVGDVNDGAGFVGETTENKGRGVRRIFWGTMPDYSVTVHVHYYEDLWSKLRLTNIRAFAWDNETKDDSINGWDRDTVPPNEVWVEKYQKELRESQADGYGVVTEFDSEKDKYVVVLDEVGKGDDWCGVEVTLRGLTIKANGVGDWLMEGSSTYYAGVNQDLPATVDGNKLSVVMRLDEGGTLAIGGNPLVGSTDDGGKPSVHKSNSFEAPVDRDDQSTMASRTVYITLSYNGSDLIPEEDPLSRVYEVRFVRRVADGKAKHVANAGNSPFGMIENASNISAEDKAQAKESFLASDRFVTGFTPTKAAGLTNIYWPEAWGDGDNLDRDETALFVFLGEDFYEPGVTGISNNAGDLLPDGTKVALSIQEYYQMDKTKTTAFDRFDTGVKTTTAPIPLGDAEVTGGAISGQIIHFSTVEYTKEGDPGATVKATSLRPGVYALTYTFPDYDSTKDVPKTLSFTRPLVVLSRNSDVDADRDVDGSGNPSTARVRANADNIWKRFGSAKLPLLLDDSVYSARDKAVYRYRIADVNNDRNINDIDADQIRRSMQTADTDIIQFYRPTDYIG